MGIAESGKRDVRGGFRIGLQDEETDNNYKSLCYFGESMEAGINTEGTIILDGESKPIPGGFNFQNFTVKVNVRKSEGGHNLILHVYD